MSIGSEIAEMWYRLDVKSKRIETDAGESKTVCEMQFYNFTIETRRRLRAMVALWSRYGRAMSAPVRPGPHCHDGLDVM